MRVRSGRLARGIAVGTVIAVIVLISVTAFALWKIWETTTAGYRSISEHALIAQEPLFRISDMNIVGDKLVINIANTGPSASTVKSVYLYRYEASGTPAQIEVQSQPRDTYVPVGETFNVTIPLSKLYEYMSFERPLRILIETERGTSLIGSEPPVAHITVSVIVPQNVDLNVDTVRPLTLKLCGYSVALAPSPESRPPYFVAEVIRTSGFTTTYLVRATVLAVGECTVKLEGKVKIFEVGNKDITGQMLDDRPIDAYIQVAARDVDVETKLKLRPGGTYEVEFNLPSILATDIEYIPPEDVKPTLIYDFSWYFIRDRNNQDGLVNPREVGKILYEKGVVRPASPSGCKLLHPYEWDDEVMKFMQWYYKGSDDYFHVGLPVVVALDRRCANNGNVPFLTVQVPMEIPQGQHIVIPVFTYDDDDGTQYIDENNLPALIYLFMLDDSGRTVASNRIYESGESGPTQIAYPMLVDSRGGVMYLNITVVNSGPGRMGDGRAIIVLSKVILFKVGDYASACSYTGKPLPFATVHLTSGNLGWAARVVFSPLHLEPNATRAAENVPNLALYSTTYNVTQNRNLEATSYEIRVGGTTVNNARSEMNYIAGGYKVTVGIVGRQANSALDAVVHQGYGADSPYSPGIYKGLLYYMAFTWWGWPSVLVASNGTFTLTVTVRFGESGEHHVYILFEAYGQRVDYYSSLGNARLTRHGDFYGLYAKGSVSAGSEHSFSITVVPYSGLFGSGMADLNLMYVIVVKKPSDSRFVIASGDNLGRTQLFQDADGGLYALNVYPVNNARGAYVVFRLLRLDSGETIGSWKVPVEWLGNDRNNVVLPINGATVDPLLYLQYRNYALIVHNAKCGAQMEVPIPPPGTETQTLTVVKWYPSYTYLTVTTTTTRTVVLPVPTTSTVYVPTTNTLTSTVIVPTTLTVVIPTTITATISLTGTQTITVPVPTTITITIPTTITSTVTTYPPPTATVTGTVTETAWTTTTVTGTKTETTGATVWSTTTVTETRTRTETKETTVTRTSTRTKWVDTTTTTTITWTDIEMTTTTTTWTNWVTKTTTRTTTWTDWKTITKSSTTTVYTILTEMHIIVSHTYTTTTKTHTVTATTTTTKFNTVTVPATTTKTETKTVTVTTTVTETETRTRRGLPPTSVIVAEGSGVRLPQYAVRVELNGANFGGWDAVSADGGDIFFVDGRTGLPLYYWVESFDRERRSAVVWVRVDSVPAKGTVPVLMFYGGENPFRGQFHDPGKVFYYFNDFEGGSLQGMTVFGASSWRVDSGGAQGLYAASGGPRTSGLRLEVDLPTQALVSFQVKVSPGSARDALIFRVDGVERVRFSGGLDWGQFSFVAPAGTRTFEWVYVGGGGGRAWVDSVVVRPYVSPEPTVVFGEVAAG